MKSSKVEFESIAFLDGSFEFKFEDNIRFTVKHFENGKLVINRIFSSNITNVAKNISECFRSASNLFGIKSINFVFRGVEMKVTKETASIDTILKMWREQEEIRKKNPKFLLNSLRSFADEKFHNLFKSDSPNISIFDFPTTITKVFFEKFNEKDETLIFKTSKGTEFSVDFLYSGTITINRIINSDLAPFLEEIKGCFTHDSNFYGISSVLVKSKEEDFLITEEWKES